METLARRPPVAALRGPVWVLVLAAFLFGATAAAVLFVGVWRHEAGRTKSADTEAQDAAVALASTTGRLRRSRAQVVATTARLRAAEALGERQAAALERLRAAGKPLAADAGRLDASAEQLAAEGAAVGDATARLTSAVAALAVYLEETGPAQLDPAYLRAQLAYLEETLGSLQARSQRLRGAAGSVSESRKRLARRAAALERLARTAPG